MYCQKLWIKDDSLEQQINPSTGKYLNVLLNDKMVAAVSQYHPYERRLEDPLEATWYL